MKTKISDKLLYIDFETASDVELRGSDSVGLWNYTSHPSTRVLMLGWAINQEEVQLWFPGEPMLKRLQDALADPEYQIVAFNSCFERYVLQHVLKIVLPASRFQDPQASARYLSLPASLEDVSVILGLPEDKAKNKEGKRLIGIFCKPSKTRKKKGEEQRLYYRDKQSDPEDWTSFCSYCAQDVIAEREVLRREALLGVWPLPPFEREIWELDQEINDRGMPVDISFVRNAYALGTKAKQAAIEMQNELTGLENANSNSQMLGWAKKRGYKPTSLSKDNVDAELKFNDQLTDECKEVLMNRKAAASTSYKKLETILRQACSDGRIRNLFSYMGSARAGRWNSSGSMQFHNQARPDERFEDLETLAWARSMIYALDYDALELWFGKPTAVKPDPGGVLAVIKSCIRTVFVAPEGSELVVSDESAIETRVAAWVSECLALLDVFRTYLCVDHPMYATKNPEEYRGICPDCQKPMVMKDPYLDFAVKLSQIMYEVLARDIKSKDSERKAIAKRFRQMGKVGVLAGVFRMGGGDLVMRAGVPTKTGVWGYSEKFGVVMSKEEAHTLSRVFRTSYEEVVKFWYLLEKLIKEVLEPGTIRVKRECGPNGCVKIDKITIEGRDPILRIQLPSGRFLHYLDSCIRPEKMPWKAVDEEGENTVDVYRPSFVYSGQNQKTKKWGQVTSHGGKLCLAGNTSVITNAGLKCITKVSKDDLVWDGTSWVGHGGLIYNGVKETIEWQGLEATSNHLILVGKQWLELGRMDSRTQLISRLSGLASVLRLLLAQSQGNTDELNLSVIAEKRLTYALALYGEDMLGAVHPAVALGKGSGKRKTLPSTTQNYGICGCIDELELFPDATILTPTHTKTTADEELQCIRSGETVQKHGSNTQEHSWIGINSILILTVETIMEIMNREISGLELECRMLIIREKLCSLNIKNFGYLIQNSEGDSCPYGVEMLCSTILLEDAAFSGVSTFTKKQEVYDLLNCGPNNRFTIMTQGGPLVVHNCENIVQGIARDVLASVMLKCKKEYGFEQVAHVHDEVVMLRELDPFLPGLRDLEKIMEESISWADNLPLKGEGFSGPFYRKG